MVFIMSFCISVAAEQHLSALILNLEIYALFCVAE